MAASGSADSVFVLCTEGGLEVRIMTGAKNGEGSGKVVVGRERWGEGQGG